jgi:TetR/AcrR family transcriptional repressor of nem operon
MARPKLSNRNTKAELVQTAKEIILTKGFHAFTYEDLANRVKIRKASIHYYFPSKVDLGVHILNFGTERLDSFFQSLKNQKLSPLQQLKVYFDLFFIVFI